jgi:hypothetical protein
MSELAAKHPECAGELTLAVHHLITVNDDNDGEGE